MFRRRLDWLDYCGSALAQTAVMMWTDAGRPERPIMTSDQLSTPHPAKLIDCRLANDIVGAAAESRVRDRKDGVLSR